VERDLAPPFLGAEVHTSWSIDQYGRAQLARSGRALQVRAHHREGVLPRAHVEGGRVSRRARCHAAWCRQEHRWHVAARAIGVGAGPAEITLVGGRGMYVAILRRDGSTPTILIEHRRRLRSLATAILAELDATKPKPRRRRQ
jgi:hypothetical protein